MGDGYNCIITLIYGDVKGMANENTERKPPDHMEKRFSIRNPIILPQLLFILKRYQRESGYLIRGQRSKKDEPITEQALKNLYDRIEKATKESGIHFDFKSINRQGRHTMATFMNNAELDDKTIESHMGHYDARFTRERYMNAQARQEEREMNK